MQVKTNGRGDDEANDWPRKLGVFSFGTPPFYNEPISYSIFVGVGAGAGAGAEEGVGVMELAAVPTPHAGMPLLLINFYISNVTLPPPPPPSHQYRGKGGTVHLCSGRDATSFHGAPSHNANRCVSSPDIHAFRIFSRTSSSRHSVRIYFTSALVGGEWSASRPGPPYPRGRIVRYPMG
jgi:hypothetical protein